MSRRQYLEWEAFYQIDPWDGERIDLLIGIVCSYLAAAHGADIRPCDAMPDWLDEQGRKKMPTKEEHEAKMDEVFARLRTMRQENGGDNRINGNPNQRPDSALAKGHEQGG